MNRDELLQLLVDRVDANGTTQFNYSSDPTLKTQELELLALLVEEDLIQQKAAALGFAVYSIL